MNKIKAKAASGRWELVDPSNGEPLLAPAILMGVLVEGLAVAQTFGWELTPGQSASLLAFIGVAVPAAIWAWGRQRAWSPRSVAAATAAARGE